RLCLAALMPVFPDETYYWEWSRHLAAGYFDHPPAIAVAIRLGTSLLGLVGLEHTSFAVRFAPVVIGSIGILAVVETSRRIAGGRASLLAAIVLSAMPLAATGLVLATPDAPLLAATAFVLLCVVRAVQSDARSRDALVWWIAAG